MTTRLFNIDPVLVDAPMPIITPRLILRPPQRGDGYILSDAKRVSWAELQQWMPWAQGDIAALSVEQEEILCRRKQADYLLREDIMLFAFERETNTLVASSGLHRMDWKTRIFEIGYWVRSDATGQGYATEITHALLRYAFNQLAANRVTICHDNENGASRRVIEKLGFVKEGEAPLDGVLHGRFRGTSYYARYDLSGLPPLDVRWECEP
ncbi:MAG: GNAT family N-acetyltransferase [Rhodospirillales bacterium]|nr:GNAT family N-acetyltransferase [Rhodospirillales bacterium]MCB9965671.1 GNAT family N-acetyltransferase [Rhodospirillales bacterium]